MDTELVTTGEKPLVLSGEFESIAQLMLEHRGDLARVAKSPHVTANVMQLRRIVAGNEEIRLRYGQLLREELESKGLHISERILRMADLQERAFGDDEEGIPADAATAINLSREISRLIMEAKGINMSSATSGQLVSRETPTELLQHYLDS